MQQEILRPIMKRTAFVKAYAERNDLNAEYAILGFAGTPEHRLMAMPCGCRDEGCEGWVMLSGEQISHHLSKDAPEPLRSAYLAAIGHALDNMIF